MAPEFPSPAPSARSDAIYVGTQCCESPAVTTAKFPSPSAPCMYRPSEAVRCEDPPCSDTSEVPPTCSVLNPQAPPFVSHFEVGPSHVPLFTDSDQSDPVAASQVMSDPSSSDSSSFCQETSLLPSTRVHDEDVTLLKSHFDPGGSEVPVQVQGVNVDDANLVPTVEGLPEHVTQLFLDTFQQGDFPIEATNDLKQLLIDHQHTLATSSADIGFCSILQHDIDTGGARPIRQAPRKPPLATRDAEDEILNKMLKTGVIEPSMSS